MGFNANETLFGLDIKSISSVKRIYPINKLIVPAIIFLLFIVQYLDSILIKDKYTKTIAIINIDGDIPV